MTSNHIYAAELAQAKQRRPGSPASVAQRSQPRTRASKQRRPHTLPLYCPQMKFMKANVLLVALVAMLAGEDAESAPPPFPPSPRPLPWLRYTACSAPALNAAA
jgi:hypothetical protein